MDDLRLDRELILPTLTKFLAGGTAMMGSMDEKLRRGKSSDTLLNQSASFLIHPLDIPELPCYFKPAVGLSGVWRPCCAGRLREFSYAALGHAYFGLIPS
ncbi:MAG: hypothetical protein IPL29_07445 [Propionivibrio sp.]|nr:hypothetical protein [Propionivibrio sp.]